MSDFVLMTDSSCDLPGDLSALMGISVVPLSVTVDDKDTYKNYLDHREIPIHDFYNLMRAGKLAVTAASCPDGDCIRCGEKNTNPPIVCLPNRVSIQFSADGAVDGVVR